MILIPKILFSLAVIYQVLTGYAVGAENILFVIGFYSSQSHRTSFEPLAYKLAERGHNVTFISPERFHQTERPNVTEFCPPPLKFHNDLIHESFGIEGLKSRLASKNQDLFADFGRSIFETSIAGWEDILKSKEMQDFIRTSSFDLVIVDKTSISDCMYALSHQFGAKTIQFLSVAMLWPWDYFNHGIPFEQWWIPMIDVVSDSPQSSLVDRIKSIYTLLTWRYVYETVYLPELDRMMREVLNSSELPPVKELIKRDSLIFLNSYPADFFAKSLPPFVIQVGGMHLEDSPKPLSEKLENFIAKGTKGFIYVSFGSIVRFASAPQDFLTVFVQTMESLKDYQFLWKWEGDKPENISSNVICQPWFPQQDILGHSKIRGFISQGGQISIQQAIHNGVPLITLPVNGDQDLNAKRLRDAGNGIHLDLFGLTFTTLRESIIQLLDNKSYSEVAAQLKKISRDRPMSSVDKAVWWTEFVLRQEDTQFFKPAVKPWWMLLSIDVVGVAASIALIFLVFVILMILIFFKIIYFMYKGVKMSVASGKNVTKVDLNLRSKKFN